MVSANKVRLLNPSNRDGETMRGKKKKRNLMFFLERGRRSFLFHRGSPVNVDAISTAFKDSERKGEDRRDGGMAKDGGVGNYDK